MNSIERRHEELKKMSPEKQSEAKIESVDDLIFILAKQFNSDCDEHERKFGTELRDLTKPTEINRMKKNL